MPHLTIGKLAKQSGIKIETIRYYERSGLMKPPARSAGGYRLYQEQDAARLRFIVRAKALGFSLEEVGQLMHLSEGDADRAEVKALTQKKLQMIESKISDLQRMRDVLHDLSGQCSGQGTTDGCPIIAALND